jgi:Fungalysin metallopeptidase (M36)
MLIQGNNAVVYPGEWPPNNETMLESPEGPGLIFDSEWSGEYEGSSSSLPDDLQRVILSFDPDHYPTSPKNKRSAAIQLFFLINRLHDLFYQYGFTEVAGNFQLNSNHHPGGSPDDEVIAHISYRMTNFASFASPPDGINGRMHMASWTTSDIPRDVSEAKHRVQWITC